MDEPPVEVAEADSTGAEEPRPSTRPNPTQPKNLNNKRKLRKQKSKTESGQARSFRGATFKFRAARKRSQSFGNASKFFLPYKRPRKDTIVPPTKFLLGGNISDPLNLNSLRDEDVNRAMNAVTPKSSPLPAAVKVDVIIPPNIRDPLNLLTPLDNDEYEKQFEGKRRLRKRAAKPNAPAPPRQLPQPHQPTAPKSPAPASPASPASPAAPAAPADPPPPPARKRTASETEPKDAKKPRRPDPRDKIVSPVVPQPGAWTRHPPRPANQPQPQPAQPNPNLPKFRIKDARYSYGNYDRYYGYRNLNAQTDVRLKVFELNRHLFNNKDILDVGCNVGHVSIAVARDFGAKSVTGIDIDDKLIARARKNVTNFVVVQTQNEKDKPQDGPSEPSKDAVDPQEGTSKGTDAVREDDKQAELKKLTNRSQRKTKRNRRAHHKPSQELIKQYFPISCPILYGPTEVPGFPVDERIRFPQNIVFKQINYIPKDENLINAEVPNYDLIMCLSVTKWFHLNWGDSGIKLAFKRMFAQLRPGGKLILEAQGWASYKKKKRLTETIYKNFSAIEFFPNKFKEYLLSPEVGFSKCIVLGVPQHLSKGFRRPIHLYIKGDFTPSKVQWSDTYAPSHHQPDLSNDEQPKKVYAYVGIPSYRPSSSHWSENNTPSYGAATPYAYHVGNNSAEESPFYNPRSDSYMPSYSGSDQPRTVYASLSSPQSDYGGTPSHVTEGGGSLGGVYATMASPASPFLEPSPGNSTTPSHPFTPSHSASYESNPANKKVYASLHSPHEENMVNGTRGQPVYSPSVAGTSRVGASSGHSPLYTGPSTCPLLESNDYENANSNDSAYVKSLSEHVTPVASPLSDNQNAFESEHNSPRDSNDTD